METAGLDTIASRGPFPTRRQLADATLSRLYIQMGRESEGETAKLMARIALDLTPASIDALHLLEHLSADDERRELRGRYENFLAEVPFHPQSARVREQLIDLLLEQRDYDAALRHVRALNRASWSRLPREEIVRACDVPPTEPDACEAIDVLEILEEYELEPTEPVQEVYDYELVEVAE